MEIEQIIMKVQATEDKADRNEGRIEKLESESAVQRELVTSVAVIAEQLKTMNVKFDRLEGKVDTMESKPAKRLDWLVNVVLGAIVGAAVAFLLNRIGL